MRHRLRLAGPAVAFSVTGGVLLAVGTRPEMQMVGGFTTSGGYALALQIVLSLLLLAIIDDLREPPPIETMMRPATRSGSRPAAINSGIRGALWHFYLGHPLASAALAFGLAGSIGVSLSGLLDGDADGLQMIGGAIAPSAIPMGIIMVATALVQLLGRALAFLGWCTGFAAGSFLVQIRFAPGVDVDRTWQVSVLLVVTLLLVRALVHTARAPRQLSMSARNISRERQ